MKTSLDHLPKKQQRELTRISEILHGELADVLAMSTKDWKRQGRILKIILFGSYARGGWVDEPHTAKGYQSDFDILVIVNHDNLTDFSEFWLGAEDRIIIEPTIQRPVNFIVHTMEEVNKALSHGQYFFTDIVEEGIALYDRKGSEKFRIPTALTPAGALEIAQKHFDHAFGGVHSFFDGSSDAFDRGHLNKASFDLHQAVERLYSAVLLVFTNYTPPSHNIKFLRSLCESHDQRLISIWPRETKAEEANFELLKRAYVEARYSEHFKISEDELNWLRSHADALCDLCRQICLERLASLNSKV